MTFIPPKPGGWAANDPLTGSQITALQAAIQAADADMQAQVTANLATLIAESRRTLTARHRLKGLDLNAVTPSDTGASLGVSSINSGRDVLLVKGTTNGVFAVQDTELVSVSGVTVASITSACKKVVKDSGSRYLAIGAGGNQNAFSLTNGNTWSAGGASSLGADPVDCVWDGTEFIMSTGAGDSAHSTTGASWTNAGAADDIANVMTLQFGGLAVLTPGTVIAAGTGSGIEFAVSTDHGASWVNTGGTVPDGATNYTNSGWIAGNGGGLVYWLGNPDVVSSNRLDLCVSSDGVNWTLRSSITDLPAIEAFGPKLLMCQDTGMLVSIADIAGSGFVVNVSTDLGFTWSGNLLFNVTSKDAIGVARGRIFATIGAKLFASDGVVV